uniref:(northern house mosquito) hypothetical protein n=1 Tax=Culex pipiens TaxID=7175 RepID=A0A8D8B2Z5_CULPI
MNTCLTSISLSSNRIPTINNSVTQMETSKRRSEGTSHPGPSYQFVPESMASTFLYKSSHLVFAHSLSTIDSTHSRSAATPPPAQTLEFVTRLIRVYFDYVNFNMSRKVGATHRRAFTIN